MKRQRNTQKVKEQDKCPPKQIKEEEIGNLPDKEFRIMIVKMIQNLENKIELQINRPGTKIDWLFFISSRSLLNISCIFSILVSSLFICNSILFSRCWIIFTTIIWNSLWGRFPVSFSFVWFGGHLSCSFTFWVFLCLFILFIFLCLGWPFCILAVCGVLFIVEFPLCGWGSTGGLSRFLG